MSNKLDYSFKRFGHWIVISKDMERSDRKRKQYWFSLCICGKTKSVYVGNLTRGLSASCSCKSIEVIKSKNTTHGSSYTKLYTVWNSMKNRCDNPKVKNYHNYGGRGIKVCKEWYDFNKFKMWSISNGYEENLQLDRKDNNGNYSPENCRWVTAKVNANNTRANDKITIGGITKNQNEWASEIGISNGTFHARIKRGISGGDLLKPLRGKEK